jgi:hypothetical protein
MLRPYSLAQLFAQVRAIAHYVQQGTPFCHFDNSERSDGYTDAISEATHIDSQQRTQHNPNGCLVRDNQNITRTAGLLDLF